MANWKYASLEERLLANSVISTENFYTHEWGEWVGEITACWEWIGPKRGNSGPGRKDGYPAIHLRWKSGPRKGKVRLAGAHRISLQVFRGRYVGNKMVCKHLCNNKNCINPMHLVGGTQRSNVRQCIKEGRHGNMYRAPVNGRKEVAHAHQTSGGSHPCSLPVGEGRDRCEVEEVAHAEEELAAV